ncbi:MAG: glycosyltransferase family 4 protein, partial [Gemmataceae bacterium]|nr:glycosyltransferase family 4 protein [Gemmataceae bacterium]
MASLHVAILDEELPYPPTSGKRIRTYQLLRRLAERHRLTFFAHRHADPEEALAAQDAFARLGIRTIVLDRPLPAKSGATFYARLAGNLLSALPYSVASHAAASYVAAVRDFAQRQRVQLWHCEWTPYAQVLRAAFGPTLPQLRWTIMAHNVESLIWQRYAAIEPHPLKRWYLRLQQVKYERFEQWAYTAATLTIAVSQADARLMQQRFGATRLAVVENGVDVEAFRPQRDVERDPYHLLFVGSLDWRPNLDAVNLLLEQIFPAVAAAEPRARLSIVGRRPPQWLRLRCTAFPRVHLMADVADVRPFLACCGMLVVPLRVGGGTRLKILEALASGTPVISTTLGAEGLDLLPGQDLLIADSPQQFISAIHEAFRRPLELQDQAANARQKIIRRHSWNHLAQHLDDLWQATADHVPRRTSVTIPPAH